MSPRAEPSKWTVLAIVGVGVFMATLDSSIVNVSLPTIAAHFRVPLGPEIEWVVIAYLAVVASVLLTIGRLADIYGHRRIWTLGLVVFSVSSALCGVAPSIGALIAARGLQGIGGAMLMGVSPAMLVAAFPPEERGRAIGLNAVVVGLGVSAGPSLGGLLTEHASWRWIFFINLPIGIFASVVVANQLRGKVEKTERPRIDYVGLITLVIGVGALQIVLDKGNDADWFNSNFIIVASIVSAIAIAIFLIWELTDPDPIVDLKLFRHRNFTTGTLAMVLGYAAFFSIALLVPLWLQQNLGYTATWAGFATAPLGVIPVLLTFFVGKYATRMDLRLLAAASFLVMGVTCFMRADFYLQIDFYHVAMVQLLQGLGVALFFMPTLTILLSDLQQDEIAAGSGLSTFLRTLGGSFSASITTLMWTRGAVNHHEQLAEHITPYSPIAREAMQRLGHGDPQLGGSVINGMITQQGFQISFNEVFHALGWIFIGLMLVIWLAKPPFTPKARQPAGGH